MGIWFGLNDNHFRLLLIGGGGLRRIIRADLRWSQSVALLFFLLETRLFQLLWPTCVLHSITPLSDVNCSWAVTITPVWSCIKKV